MELTPKTRRLTATTFTLYFLLLVWIIAFKCNMKDAVLDAKIFNRDFTLEERFAFQLSQFSKTNWEDGVLNILFFLPLGLLMPLFSNKHTYVKTVLLCFLISAGFELLQIVNAIGRFTYIDIINNTVGGAIGSWICFLLRKKVREKSLANTFAVLIVILLPALIAAIVNTIVHIEYYL
jgi:glycopeptide antibiotics resistance protein